jgi:hypothetical protein
MNISASGVAAATVQSTFLAIDKEALQKYEGRVNSLAREQVIALQRFLGEDPIALLTTVNSHLALVARLEKDLDLIRSELSEFFIEGVRPIFDPKKERRCAHLSYYKVVYSDIAHNSGIIQHGTGYDKIVSFSIMIMPVDVLLNGTLISESAFIALKIVLLRPLLTCVNIIN